MKRKPASEVGPGGTPTRGRSAPIGAVASAGGVNFCVYSRTASSIDLLLFDHVDDPHPARTVRLDPVGNRTYHYWHVYVPGLVAGQLYGYRAGGPFAPADGLRFDAKKVLLDPYARAVAVPAGYDRGAAGMPGDNTATAFKAVVIDPGTYDWQGDTRPHRPAAGSIIYELHVRGFTRHPSSGVGSTARGTYAGLVEKIPYLLALGITAVELMPVFQFDAQAAPPGLVNYWGYAPVSCFAPHPAYSSRPDPQGAVDEFRDMVKAFHKVGIEVILDVVFNHTAEGDHHGPTLNFRGLDNPTYYILEQDRSRYADYSGTGNTLNSNNSIVRRMILDSLRYWVETMHVDGFRFDLASILSRDESGNLMPVPPVLWDIETDPVLAGTKLIAEAWDAAGLYQVGSFIGDSWREWNGRFRDDVRSFLRGEDGTVNAFADRLLGSPQIYGHKLREPEASVNFVTCHDGFTLNDLVSYDQKHNDANGEHNRDGADDNRSWNCGVEGPADDPVVEALRTRQVKNFLVVTVLSFGLPMILMGDEVRRTQQGNNNAYCQDNEIGWFDWSLARQHGEVLRFLKLLNTQRLLRGSDEYAAGISLTEALRDAKTSWHGTRLNMPDWSASSHSLALGIEDRGLTFHVIVNAYWESLDFELPREDDPLGAPWHRWIDTTLASPDDIVEWDQAPPLAGMCYRVGPRSVVILFRRAVNTAE